MKAPSQELKSFVFNHLGDTNEVQSSIPSRMKRFSTLDIKTEGLLRVKRRTVIFTDQQNNFELNKEEGQDEIAPSRHIIVRECEDSDSEIEIVETPKTLEDGG